MSINSFEQLRVNFENVPVGHSCKIALDEWDVLFKTSEVLRLKHVKEVIPIRRLFQY